MSALLRALTVAFALIALALAIGSFAPLPLDDFARFTVRFLAFLSLASAYVAFEARLFVEVR